MATNLRRHCDKEANAWRNRFYFANSTFDDMAEIATSTRTQAKIYPEFGIETSLEELLGSQTGRSFGIFRMRLCISIRGCVGPSVRPSVGPSVGPSVTLS